MEVRWFSYMAEVIVGQLDVAAVALVVIAAILGLLLLRKTSEVRALESLQETLAQLAARNGADSLSPTVPVKTPLPVALAETPVPVTAVQAPPAAVPAEKADPQLLAVLIAAATMVVGKPVAVRRITIINRGTVSGWAEAGRTSIHLSHNPRRN